MSMSRHQEEIVVLQNWAVLYYNKGLKLAKQKYISDAVQELKKAVSIDGAGTEGWDLLGLCYYRLGEYKNAEYCWSESLKLKPEGIDASRYLEEVSTLLNALAPVLSDIEELAAKRKFKRASSRFEKEIIPFFGPAAALFNFGGLLRYAVGDRREAIGFWKKTLELDRSNPQAVYYILEEAAPPGFITRWFRSWFSRD